MKKLTKIGVSALAGSLVATAASAGSLSVGGTWEVTGEYTHGAGAAAFKALNNNGNPFGSKGNLSFSGSGETDFGTASFYLFTNDQQSGTSSHSVSLDMGDMGTVAFDQGTGGYGLGTIDDKAPSAYEEVWNGTTATNTDIMDGAGGSANVFGYKNTIMGMDLTVEYDPSVGDGDAGDGANSFTDANYDGSNINFAVTNATLVDGLTFGAGYGETSWDRESGTTTKTETNSVAAFANYAFGPVTVGVQQNYTSGSVGATGIHAQANEVTIMGIAFNVNDNLSVSYQDYENKYLKSSTAATGSTGQADVTQDADGIQVAYTMGGATLRISDVTVDNSGGTAGDSEDRTEVSLLMAF
jgi:outer membrane protein OmpU